MNTRSIVSLVVRATSSLLCLAWVAACTPEAGAANPRVKMETSLGDILLELDADKAPLSTQNFIQYANDKFYDGTVFHRVIPTFMIQGGGFTVELDKKEGVRDTIKNEWRNGLKNNRGTIAMARLGGDADSASSQFFINVVDNPALDRPQPDGAAYAVFGKVIEGMDIVDKIRDVETTTSAKYPGGKVVPATPVVIKSVRVQGDYDLTPLQAKAKEAEAQASKAAGSAQAAGKAFLAKNRAVEGVKETASGLQYQILKEGEGPKPAATDTVTVHYRGTLIDGTEFDSSYKRGEPISFPLNGVIAGWTEGLQLMSPGGKTKLFIPSDLAYGARGAAGGLIPPHAALIFEVELIKIN